MKAYNIYYESERINDYPLDKKTLLKVMDEKYIYKKNNVNGIKKIPTNQIITRICTIV